MKTSKAPNKLTAKQQRFVAEYLIDLNATQAAIRAGYSKRTAQEQSSRLLSNVMVAAAIAKLQLKRQERTDITADRVLQEVGRIAFFDIRKIFNQDGTLKKVIELDDDTAAAIASIEVIDIGADGQLIVSKKFKATDKGSALDRLMKHLGMYEKDNSQMVNPLAEALKQLNRSAVPVVKDVDE